MTGRQLELQKNPWISGMTLDFCTEGMFKGALLLTITFTGTKNADSNLTALVLQTVLETKLPVNKVIRFAGHFAEQDHQMYLLVDSLAQRGYSLQAVTDGTFLHEWLQKVAWHIVRTDKNIILPLCSEVWFQPNNPAELTDVECIALPDGRPFMFLDVAKAHLSVDQTIEFFIKARRPFQLK